MVNALDYNVISYDGILFLGVSICTDHTNKPGEVIRADAVQDHCSLRRFNEYHVFRITLEDWILDLGRVQNPALQFDSMMLVFFETP